MSPIPPSERHLQEVPSSTNDASLHHFEKRVNLNPFHYLTLPIKNNWPKISPLLDKYNHVTRTMAILLGGLGLIVMLDQHHWKLPRWPWAKDGRNNPDPSFKHENERYTVDELAEKKLMEMLKEIKAGEGGGEIGEGKKLPTWEGDSEEDEVKREGEEEFLEDAEEGAGEIIEEMEMGEDFLG